MNTLEIVLGILKDYQDLEYDSLDIQGIMHMRKQLSTHGVFLSSELALARKDWKQKEANYEILKNQKRVKLLDKGTTKANWIARANLEAELNESVEAESLYYEFYNILQFLKEVLSEMNQRIAILREEYKQSTYGQKQV